MMMRCDEMMHLKRPCCTDDMAWFNLISKYNALVIAFRGQLGCRQACRWMQLLLLIRLQLMLLLSLPRSDKFTTSGNWIFWLV